MNAEKEIKVGDFVEHTYMHVLRKYKNCKGEVLAIVGNSYQVKYADGRILKYTRDEIKLSND